MPTNPERERPSARANLKIVLKPLGEISAEAEVPESESRSLLDIPRSAFSFAGLALVLLVASYVGLPLWAVVGLAGGQLVINGVGRYLDARRATGVTASPALRRRPKGRPNGQGTLAQLRSRANVADRRTAPCLAE